MDENDSFVVNPPRPRQTSLDSDEGQSNLSPLAIENASYHVSDAHERMVSGLVREINCDSAVPSIAYSPDGTQVFVGRYDKKVCQVNVPNSDQVIVTARLHQRLIYFSQSAYFMSILPGGRLRYHDRRRPS